MVRGGEKGGSEAGRWKFRMDGDCNLHATAKVDELRTFVVQAGRELQEKIMEHEEKLILETVSMAGLTRLIELCQNEIERRKTHDHPTR